MKAVETRIAFVLKASQATYKAVRRTQSRALPLHFLTIVHESTIVT